MKKLVVAILTLFYFISVSGASVQLHYCMGKLVETGLWHSNSTDKCSGCGMKKSATKKNSCCRDEQKKIVQDNNQKIAEHVYASLSMASALAPVQWAFQPSEAIVDITTDYPVSHAPPRSADQPIYLLNSNFRI